MKAILEPHFSVCLSKFLERVLPIPDLEHGILLSEGFAVCAMCDLFGIKILLESGICEGKSTLMFGKYLGSDGLVKSVDLNPVPVSVYERLRPYNIDIRKGDATTQLPEWAERYAQSRLGVFIDGPKREASVKLAVELLRFSNVCFVGIHDLHLLEIKEERVKRGEKYNGARQLFNAIGGDKFLTSELWFVDAYRHLDFVCPKSKTKYWLPGGYKNAESGFVSDFGSYGYTVGFLLKKEMCVKI